tara:strand:+ start:114 stop:446 length:333 start_codon:yes stop_codon:yes gene_type:complete
MTQTYIIKWGEFNENQKKIINKFNNNSHEGYLYQKYNNINNVIPKINDYILVKLNDINIMKCRVVDNYLHNNIPSGIFYIGRLVPNYNQWLLLQIVETFISDSILNISSK